MMNSIIYFVVILISLLLLIIIKKTYKKKVTIEKFNKKNEIKWCSGPGEGVPDNNITISASRFSCTASHNLLKVNTMQISLRKNRKETPYVFPPKCRQFDYNLPL